MRSRSFITNSAVLLALLALLTCQSALAQRVAILTPNGSPLDEAVATNTKAALSGAFRIQDLEMSATALEASGKRSNAFNLTADEAHDVAAVLGCNFIVAVRTGTLRRASLEKADHWESFATFFVVSGRTGLLIKWKLFSEIGSDAADAEHRLTHSLTQDDLAESIRSAWNREPLEQTASGFEQVPEPGTPAAKNFRAPAPYRRLKPEYTRLAYLYDITASVEATVDLDDRGAVTNVAITRWAGFGLDESVEKTIRGMNWRPAEQNGKALASRFLVRYNFRKIDKDDPNNE
jgi:TonB-like protein